MAYKTVGILGELADKSSVIDTVALFGFVAKPPSESIVAEICDGELKEESQQLKELEDAIGFINQRASDKVKLIKRGGGKAQDALVLASQIKQLEQVISERKALLEKLQPYEHINLEFSKIVNTKRVRMTLGLIEAGQVFEITSLVQSYPQCNIMIMFSETAYKKLGTRQGYSEPVPVYIAGTDGFFSLYNKLLERGYSPCRFDYDKKPHDVIVELEQEIKQLNSEYSSILTVANSSLRSAYARYEALNDELEKKKARYYVAKSRDYFGLWGKVPEVNWENLKKTLQGEIDGKILFFEDEGEMASANEFTNIIKSIEDLSIAEANDIIVKARQAKAAEREQRLAEARAEADASIEAATAEAAKRQKTILEATAAQIQSDNAAAKTAARQGAIECALEKLFALSDKEYITVVVSLLKHHAVDGDVIVGGVGDERRINQKLINAFTQRFGTKLEFCTQAGNFMGGVLIKRGEETIDLTFLTLLNQLDLDIDRLLFR